MAVEGTDYQFVRSDEATPTATLEVTTAVARVSAVMGQIDSCNGRSIHWPFPRYGIFVIEPKAGVSQLGF